MGYRWYARCAALLALAACSAGTNLPTSSALPRLAQAASSSKIHHIVIIVQENRTVDNLFNGFPGADTVRSGPNSQGKQVQLAPISLTEPYDLGHTHQSFKIEYASGKIDGFDKVDSRCYSINECLAKNVRAYGYVPRSQAQPYFVMATRYAFADHMFQTNQGPSFPAHQYLVSGTSSVANGSSLRAADNPASLAGVPTGGCDSPSGSLVPLIDSTGKESQYVYPCFERLSLMELLDKKGLSWRYYEKAPGPGLFNAPDAIVAIRKNPEFATDVVTNSPQVLKDVAHGELADVTWVTPMALASDHARANNGSGPSWVAAIVNAIGKSSYWNDTAIFVTWDDWGGWYDHVAPPVYNSYELSFRVPLVVISPYAKNHYVSHKQHEFGSILKFAEETFGLGSLHATDERADNLYDCFDFSKSPSKFKPIPAPLPPRYFLKQPFGGGAPDDDTGYGALYSFGQEARHDDGQAPVAQLVAIGEHLYGTTQYGGSSGSKCALGCGTLFSVSETGKERVLYRFTGGAGGSGPTAGLVTLGGSLFGTTSAGGSSTNCTAGCGTIFKSDSNGKNGQALYTFAGGRDGANPAAGLLVAGSSLFGTTQFGGMQTRLCSSGCGTVFRIASDGTSETVLHAFKGGSDGSQPVAGLIEYNGALYGTTQYGGGRTSFCAIGCGSVFRIDPNSGAETVIHRFDYGPNKPDGANPAGGLVEIGGALYGTTLGGGASAQGTVFRITGSGAESVIHSFSCCKSYADGTNPVAGLLETSAGLYGTTRFGGAQGRGTIFSITASGTESVLYSFGDRPDGAQPSASLVSIGSALYGTTVVGGVAGEGTVFALTP